MLALEIILAWAFLATIFGALFAAFFGYKILEYRFAFWCLVIAVLGIMVAI